MLRVVARALRRFPEIFNSRVQGRVTLRLPDRQVIRNQEWNGTE